MTTLPSLTAASTLTGAETLYAVQSNADRKATAAQLAWLGNSLNGVVNVKDPLFGAVGDNSNDDTAAIQAAIDYAFANQLGAVYIPPGRYKVTSTIYMDPPSNMRANGGSPVFAQFTMTVFGVPNGPCLENGNSIIQPVGDFRVFIIGSGRGLSLKNISFSKPPTTTRAGRSPDSIAVSYVSNGSRSTMEGVSVYGFYKGFEVGYNADGLTDSNTWLKCHVQDCYIGVHIRQTQNYINSIYDTNFEQCKYSVVSDVGKGVNVIGGNCSTYDAARKVFTISAVSAFSLVDGKHTFTATVASPDAAIAAGDYDAFCVRHDAWGVIPLIKTGYSAGTITLALSPDWILSAFGQNDDITVVSNIAANVATCTTLYAAERITSFQGTGIHAFGVHIENPQAVTTVFDGSTGFTGDSNATLEHIYLNWRPSGEDYATAVNDNLALFYVQQCTPLIQVRTGTHVTIRGWTFPVDIQPVVFQANGSVPVKFESLAAVTNPTLRTIGNVPAFTGYDTAQASAGIGFGSWDRTPFAATGVSQVTNAWRQASLGKTEFRGYNHAPEITPRITPTQLAAIEGATVGAAGTYPPIHGDTIYQIISFGGATPTNLFCKAHHVGWSYGKDWTCSWSYVAGTNRVTVSSTDLFFNGLCIKLDNGLTTQEYIVTAVHPFMGYITVLRAVDQGDTFYLSGVKGTTYTGATIKQSAIVFSKF